MVYREAANPNVERELEQSGPLAKIDANGACGANGPYGRHGSGLGVGSPGADAGPAARGEDGGAIRVALEADPQRDHVARIAGSIDAEVDFARDAAIQLVARGGRGGNGGTGGNGEDGARGRSGSAASRYSSGDNGGTGGNGGDEAVRSSSPPTSATRTCSCS